MVFRGIFAKIFKRRKGTGAFLRFVKNDERIRRAYGNRCFNGKRLDNALDIKIAAKNILDPLVIVKADIGNLLIVHCPKFLHEPGLANLAHPIQYQGLAVALVFPFFQFFYGIPLHLKNIVGYLHINLKNLV